MAIRQLKITKQITNRDTKSLGRYFSEVNSIKLLSSQEEKELAKLAASGDEKAIEKLITSNLRFVISVAKQYQNTGELIDELICAGNIGLIEAAKRFDDTRGFKFISYAVWWVRQSIMQHLGENHRPIRLPLNKISLLNKIKNIQSEFEQIHQRMPDAEELSIAINEKYEDFIPEKTIESLLSSSYNISSLDAALTENGESGTLNDLLEGDGLEKIYVHTHRADLKIKLNSAMKRLSLKEKTVIILFFGLEGEERGLSEIGTVLDLTRERVRQIKESALRKMKFQRNKTMLKEYL